MELRNQTTTDLCVHLALFMGQWTIILALNPILERRSLNSCLTSPKDELLAKRSALTSSLARVRISLEVLDQNKSILS